MKQLSKLHEPILVREPTSIYHTLKPVVRAHKNVATPKIIPRPIEQSQVCDFLDSDGHGSCVVTGYTGIGKSTLIKAVLGINDEPLHVDGDSLTLVIRFNPRTSSSNLLRYYASHVELAWKHLRKTCGATLNETQLYEEFYSFVAKNRQHLLSFARPVDNTDPTPKEFYLNFMKKHPLEFSLEACKFWLKKANALYLEKEGKPYVSQLQIVVDDVEGDLSHAPDQHLERIQSMQTCLLNQQGFDECERFRVKILFGIRPSSLAHIMNINRDFYHAFSAMEEVCIDSPLPVTDVFNNALELVSAQYRDNPGWRSRYNDACDIAKRLEQDEFHYISGFSNHNVRDYAEVFFDVLCDSAFFVSPAARSRQHGGPVAVGYGTNLHDRVAFALSIGYVGWNLYSSVKSKWVPNLLSPDSIFMPGLDLYVATFFVSCHVPVQPMMVRSLFSKSRGGEEAETDLDLRACLNRLLKTGCIQAEIPPQREEPSDDMLRSYYSAMPRLRAALRLLGENSVLLELYRDEELIPSDFSSDPTCQLRDRDRLLLSQEIVWIAEKHVAHDVNIIGLLNGQEAITLYPRCFGIDMVTRPLVAGLKWSLEQFRNHTMNESLSRSYDHLLQRVSKLDKQLDGAVRLIESAGGGWLVG